MAIPYEPAIVCATKLPPPMDDPYREQQIIRTVMALCSLAAQSVSIDVRDDMRDEAYLLVHTLLRRADIADSEIRRQCERLASRLEVITSDTLQPRSIVLTAHASVLRLHAALEAPMKVELSPVKERKSKTGSPVPQKDLGSSHQKVLNAIASHADIRTKELVEKFANTLSARTIKRCLKDLLVAGLLMKSEKQENGAVMYRATLDRKG